MLEGLEIDADRMRAHVEASGSIVAEAVMMALAPHLGRQRAHDSVAQAVHTSVGTRESFRSALSGTPEIAKHLSGDDLDRVLQPDNYLGATDAIINNVLANEEPSSAGGSGQ
jgi:3-carboxy-cis,cis-muconate cycloisomerase